MLIVILIALPLFTHTASAKVLWDGAELVQGQIGRITIKKPINLLEQKGEKLNHVRVLKPGEKYRVYGYDAVKQQYRVGGSYFIPNIKDHVLYETPSKQKLQQFLQQKPISEQNSLLEQMVVVPKNFQNNPDVKLIKSRLSKLPVSMLNKMKTNNIKIKLIDGPITSLPEFAYLKGQVPRGWEKTNKTWDDVPGIGGTEIVAIRIGYSDYGKGHGSMNLELHETAHSLDSIVYMKISATESFKKIWRSESSNLFGENQYFKNYPEEYFAETFAMYYLNETTKNELKKKAPLTYTFFENLQ
jgi:Pro-Pro endopeptidase